MNASSTPISPPQSFLARLARYAVRHRGPVLAIWLTVIIALGALTATAGGDFVDTFKIPGTESQKAVDLLQERFPSQAGDSATIVVRADAGMNDPATRSQVESLVNSAATLPEVIGVTSPYDSPGAISTDGHYARIGLQYDKAAAEVDKDNVDKLLDFVDGASTQGFQVEVGGQVVSATETEPPGQSELIGVAAAGLILLVVFGSIIAMGLPIITALIGLIIAVLLTTLAANVFNMSTFTTAFLAMIGLGVGIDYCLFIVTRYREGIHQGLDVESAVARAIDTSGRAVAFAGTVVAIALLGLLAMGIPFVAALGIAAAIVVVVSVLVAMGLLPAILGFVGRSIDKWRVPGLGGDSSGRNGFWFRWGRTVQRRPGVFALAALAFLLILAVPVLDMRLGSSDSGNNPTSMHTRRAYDLLADGFGPGFSGPLLVTVERKNGLDSATLDGLAASLRETPGVAAVSIPTTNQAGETSVITVIPTTSPQDQATTELVNRLREDVLPATLKGTRVNAYVGGGTAAFIDLGDKISERLPIFFAAVIGLSILLLAAVFRSIIVPIKAALMNLLAIGASYGVLVAVFQWGWAKTAFGVSQGGPIESFMPMMIFGILFGLSMDYEVFLMSRVHEEYQHTRDARGAMLTGVGLTARVIAAAAAIMGSVFLSFVLSNTRVIKEFGLGLGAAILVDAFVIRLVLVPAVMTLLGDRAWYIPRWLDRVLPGLSVEGPSAVEPTLAPVPKGVPETGRLVPQLGEHD